MLTKSICNKYMVEGEMFQLIKFIYKVNYNMNNNCLFVLITTIHLDHLLFTHCSSLFIYILYNTINLCQSYNNIINLCPEYIIL